MHVVSGGQTADINGRIEVDRLKERHENNMRGTPSTLIIRLDKQVTRVLLPEQDMCLESSMASPIGPAGQQAASIAPPQDVELRKVGSRTVNGYATTKYEMPPTDNDGNKVNGTLWMTEEKSPIRMEGQSPDGTFRREFPNLKTAPIDAARFELPAAYSKFATSQIPQLPQGHEGGAMSE